MTQKELQGILDDYNSHTCKQIELVWTDGSRSGISNPEVIAMVMDALKEELNKQISGDNANKIWKGFLSVNVDCWGDKGAYKASCCIGEKRYESDSYKSKDLALCEIKGWLKGVQAKIEGTIKALSV